MRIRYALLNDSGGVFAGAGERKGLIIPRSDSNLNNKSKSAGSKFTMYNLRATIIIPYHAYHYIEKPIVKFALLFCFVLY